MSITSIALFFLVISHCNLVRSDSKLITQSCKKTPNYALCVSSINGDPRGATADVRGFATIMVSALQAKATAAQNQIKQLLRTSPALKQPLTSCGRYYDAILTGDIQQASYALETGNFKFAESGMDDAANEADSCEQEFHGKSPLTSLNKVAQDTAAVAAALVRQLL